MIALAATRASRALAVFCGMPPPDAALVAAVVAASLALAWLTCRAIVCAFTTPTHPGARPRLRDADALLSRVAPSKHGFLPARVPAFEFGGVLQQFVEVREEGGRRLCGLARGGVPACLPACLVLARRVASRARARPLPLSRRQTPHTHTTQIADAVAPVYAAADAPAFRAWLEGRLAAIDVASLPAALSRLDGAQQRALLVPLVFLGHAHRWGATAPPPAVIEEKDWAPPPALDAALTPLTCALSIQRSGSMTLLFLYNWTLQGASPGDEYETVALTRERLAPRFRFCVGGTPLGAAEDAIHASIVLTEAAATTTHTALVELFDAAADAEVSGAAADAARAAAAAATVETGLRDCLSVFHRVFTRSAVTADQWAVHLQPFYCALTPDEKGVGGAQIPWIHATDAALGLGHTGGATPPLDELSRVVAANVACLLPEERLFCAYLAAHSLAARRWLARGGGGAAGATARAHWNGAVRALVAWRATHRARAAGYLIPSAAPGAPRRSTTGGTAGYGGETGGGSSDGGGFTTPPTPTSVLDDPAATIVRSFNKLMDGRIAATRAAAVRMDALFPADADGCVEA